MIYTQQIKYLLVFSVLAILASYTNIINHNSISLALSIYIIFLSKKSYPILKRVLFRASLLTTLSLLPAIYFLLPIISLLHVFATSIGIFSCIELANVDLTNDSYRLKLYQLVQCILQFLGICFFGALVLNMPIEQWRLLNIDTNCMGFYIFTLTIFAYLIRPKFTPAFLTSVLFLGYKSNTYFIMIAVFIATLFISTALSRIKSLKIPTKTIALISIIIAPLTVLIVHLLEFDRLTNAINLIFFSTGSIDYLMQTDPRRYALTLQGIDLLKQISVMFPFNLTGTGYSTFNYLETLSLFSSDFYSSSINVSQFSMDARPHNIYLSLPVTVGFPIATAMLILALKTILVRRNTILSATLAAVLLGLAFNEFISVPSIYLIFAATYSNLKYRKPLCNA